MGRYVGYFKPYAASHDELDRDTAVQDEVRNAALSLVETVRQIRSGRLRQPDAALATARKVRRIGAALCVLAHIPPPDSSLCCGDAGKASSRSRP